MTNDEIVKALRKCGTDGNGFCEGCPADNGNLPCKEKVMHEAADLIETQQKRIKELEADAALRKEAGKDE